jgi:hypothetical protein
MGPLNVVLSTVAVERRHTAYHPPTCRSAINAVGIVQLAWHHVLTGCVLGRDDAYNTNNVLRPSKRPVERGDSLLAPAGPYESAR